MNQYMTRLFVLWATISKLLKQMRNYNIENKFTLFVGEFAVQQILLLVTEGTETCIQIPQLNLRLIQLILLYIFVFLNIFCQVQNLNVLGEELVLPSSLKLMRRGWACWFSKHTSYRPACLTGKVNDPYRSLEVS